MKNLKLSFLLLVLVRVSSATKAMPKELLPIVDKPLIQYAAEEAIAAGIDTLILLQVEQARDRRSL